MDAIRAGRLCRCLVIISFVFCLAGVAWAQESGRQVTVTTRKGETVAGVFIAADQREVVLQVAGRRMSLALDEIAVIRFGGAVQPGTSVGETKQGAGVGTVPPAAGVGTAQQTANDTLRRPVDDAFLALQELHAATEAGVRRQQYAVKLGETLPRVQAFLNDADGSFADVRLLMAAAVRDYQVPFGADTLIGSQKLWTSTSPAWRDAASKVAVARELASRQGEESHKEDPAERDVSTAAQVSGRLGTGDRRMPPEVDRSTEGAFNDVYRIEVDRPLTLSLTLDTRPCSAHLTLTDDAGKPMASNGGARGATRITKDVKPGVYHVWVGAQRPSEVGTYQLTVAAR